MRCVSVNTDNVDVVADAGAGADVGALTVRSKSKHHSKTFLCM